MGQLLKILLALRKTVFNITAEFELQRVIPNYVGASEIGVPFLEHWTKIEKEDVVFCDGQVWRIFIVGRQSVAPRAHDAFVPVSRDSIHFRKGIKSSLILFSATLGRMTFCDSIAANSAWACPWASSNAAATASFDWPIENRLQDSKPAGDPNRRVSAPVARDEDCLSQQVFLGG